MRFPWSVLANLLLALCLVVFQAPQPCRGDAQGQACTAAACACVQGCSCQVGHQKSRDLASLLKGLPTCCSSARDVSASAEAAVTAAAGCHTGEEPTHFSLPGYDTLMLTASTPTELWPRRPDGRHPAHDARRPTGPPPAPSRPPWRLA